MDPAAGDLRFMAATIRLSERHVGLTASNPSVGTLIVRDDGDGPVVVGRGITAPGGRPHAETIALAEAGERARGATAYVTLEPCAHHGQTPPCAEALVSAGIVRVVSAVPDPDARVDGKGYAILRRAGIVVAPGVMVPAAARPLSAYLVRAARKRPEVTLKMAVSRDGCIGREGGGRVAITGDIANRQTHLLRARSDAILVGVGTVLSDDPDLTCRLPGLADRSPLRIVLDARLETPPEARVVRTARHVPTALATVGGLARRDAEPLRGAGCAFLACEAEPGTERVALQELLEDLAARGLSSVLVEGGARTAATFLEQGLVDQLILVTGDIVIGAGGVLAPITADHLPNGFRLTCELRFGNDVWREFSKV